VALDVRAVRPPGAVIGVAAVAGIAWLLERNAYPSYDYAFALASAQDILAGRGTGYQVPVFSPVPHPLTLAEAIAVAPLGEAGFAVFTVFALLAFGLLCWSVFRIGATLGSWSVGLLAAATVFTSPAIFELGVRTYGDVAYAALVAFATSLEITRPRRGWPVLAVLGLAGLLRPEAWLLAGLYWLYLAPRLGWRGRAWLAGLLALAPVVWMAMDAALTSDPLHSFEVTRVYTEKADASTSPRESWIALRSLTGWPVVAGALAGAVLACRRAGRAAAVPLIVGAVALVATVGPSFLGESPVLRRYLVVPGAVLSVFFAFACLGWTGARRASRAWQAAGAGLLVVAVVVLAPERLDRWETHRGAQAGRVELLDHLREWATAPRVRSFLSAPGCRPVLVPGYGYRPYLRFWLDVPPRAVAFHFSDATPMRGTVLLPTAVDRYHRIMLADVGRATRARVLSDPAFVERFRRVAGSPRWDLYASASCRRAVERGL
jgi:hypothetical protein